PARSRSGCKGFVLQTWYGCLQAVTTRYRPSGEKTRSWGGLVRTSDGDGCQRAIDSPERASHREAAEEPQTTTKRSPSGVNRPRPVLHPGRALRHRRLACGGTPRPTPATSQTATSSSGPSSAFRAVKTRSSRPGGEKSRSSTEADGPGASTITAATSS